MVVEENVSLEKLKEFKKTYYEQLDTLKEQIAPSLGIRREDFGNFFTTIHYHACGLSGYCSNNKLVAQAIKELGIKRDTLDFKDEMENFIFMCLKSYTRF